MEILYSELMSVYKEIPIAVRDFLKFVNVKHNRYENTCVFSSKAIDSTHSLLKHLSKWQHHSNIDKSETWESYSHLDCLTHHILFIPGSCWFQLQNLPQKTISIFIVQDEPKPAVYYLSLVSPRFIFASLQNMLRWLISIKFYYL